MRIRNRLSAMCGALLIASTTSFAQTISVDMSTEFQIIRGFGGMNHTTWIKDLNEDNREKAFGNEPGEIGLSILRIHLDPNSSQFGLELPTARHAIEKGALVFATPWNVPSSMEVISSEQSKVDPSKYGQYVSHLNSFNKFMNDSGVPLYAISVQNEPDYGEWTRWTSTEMVNFLGQYAQDIENRVMAPESFQFRRAFTDPILNNIKAVENVDIIGGHIYGGGLSDYPLAREKGKEVWMTEHLLGSDANETNDWNLALTVAKEINDCMKANFNAYVWWYIRRFYGLIDETGNITDKGYVMSHYSKFIRPGAIRVGVNEGSISNVNATAYKTDSTFIMVVVNQGTKSIDINFNIGNGELSKISQFTSTATKKMTNDGEIEVMDGAFTATIAAKSITTFTTDPSNGAKAGNIAPIAVAGEDQVIEDSEGSGFTTIKLDASMSSDSDGEIRHYSWSRNDQQISWDPTLEMQLPLGTHSFILTVTDNDGATASDTLNIEFKTSMSTEIWLEAECGTVGSNWQKLVDENAGLGAYVEAIPGEESLNSASSKAKNIITYVFPITEKSNYKIWGRVIADNADDDSFWVKVDNYSWVMWNGITTGSDWHWVELHSETESNKISYNLVVSEQHTLSICLREDGTKLDRILIANTGITPEGIGGEASNCVIIEGVNEQTLNKSITIYPNPTDGLVTIASAKSFNKLSIVNIQGSVLFHKNYDKEIFTTEEYLDIEPGVYFVILQGKECYAKGKLIVR